jgi:hypothetical protein
MGAWHRPGRTAVEMRSTEVHPSRWQEMGPLLISLPTPHERCGGYLGENAYRYPYRILGLAFPQWDCQVFLVVEVNVQALIICKTVTEAGDYGQARNNKDARTP